MVVAALGMCTYWACQNKRQGDEVVGLFHGEGTLCNLSRESKSPS